MSVNSGSALVFPSVEWFQALQEMVNADPDFRRLGSIDLSMGVKVGPRVFIITFEAFECSDVREGTEYDLIDLDFFLEMSEADWQDLMRNTKENGGADLSHTLNTLDLMAQDGISKNATGDQLRADLFFRVNQSLQHFFDSSAKLDTVFEPGT
ncbi:MAG: hypothetical protein J4O03_07260 [Chloroflexi bacterium]|nr:hypothetical protein [Chloroflexota bacterium]MCH8349276.1 hypothetical protein [Chloroflexota bacterium]MCI0781192.1 hypothetical protein [Chloroflexota bacterium]MCI0793249.1 hypothetical protein [Chloroflexota bacterium]MCI0798154.1 hypothetical protein [Chloroflexota bacterium]